ncbi:copper amine oxidase N-terminal domain-containing protein [Paenibacillus sp. alder61]|uniref:stalk domain-containing protein n=1 Tax=Paenibacillus sp. alder61 TaxID=2862948 RepID=UPI001CD3E1FD|nr:stalk domain-containing protein [Paenibacillus sp. alder61]MCA1295913.1 copper amine oxidase N-terminal domain-containing protein [Paenibacillus sp. alder61]
MNFKRLVITTVIALSQVAMVLPASAEEAVTPPASNGANATTSQNQSNTGSGNTSNQTTDPSGGQGNGQTGDQTSGENQGNTAPADNGTQGKSGDKVAPDGTVNGDPAAQTPDNQDPANQVPGTTEEPPVEITSNDAAGSGQLVLMMNSKKMYQNGKEYLAGYPMEVKDNVSYVSIRAIVERAGLQIAYDGKTKETIIKRGTDELRFKVNSASYKVNGVTTAMKGKSYSVQNNFMVPLTAITKALNIKYEVDLQGKRVILNLETKPKASFSIGNKEVIAGETLVQYVTESTSPIGLPIVNEEWQGKQDMFDTPGLYVVTYRVQDSSGQWSDPFSLTIEVRKPHTPPVANFTTDKDTYKMGELITYTDQSTDEVGIKSREWQNREYAFFSPGPVTIKLTVTNEFGLTSSIEKTITITNETLYTRDEFNKLFIPVGEKYGFDGTQVPSWERVNYQFTSEPTTLIRSNSPETVYSEGILYQESVMGNTRFMVHHVNATGKNVKMYIIATNNNAETVRLTQTNLGFAGPNPSAVGVGKASVQRYYESMQNGSQYKETWIAPGEKKLVMTELSAVALKQGDVISLLADLYSDNTLQYDVILIGADKDPIATLPWLGFVEKDKHNRGTFPEATRRIDYGELVGSKQTRLLIGDNSSDPFLVGYDTPRNGEYVLNAGNFGVLYTIKLHRVAPNTLVTFNPRGGFYTGYIMINGEIVPVAKESGVYAPNENVVLFRTGDSEQSVEFLFTAAPGSNLSVNLLFQPLPQKKQP